MIYFFDTYAFVEMIKGSPSYEDYKTSKIITTLWNLMELHYACLLDLGEEKAKEIFDELKDYAIDFDEEDIINANKFRYVNNKQGKRISYVDALGYVLSLKLDVKFLTGDIAFKTFENVEFVSSR